MIQVIHDPEEMVPVHDDDKIIHIGDHYHTYSSAVCPSRSYYVLASSLT